AALVKSAVGFSQERGDVVTIENAAFARPDVAMDDAVAPGPFDFDKFDIVRWAEIGALLITALALVFFVLRPLINGLFAKSEPEDRPAEIAALKGAQRAKAIAAFQASPAAAALPAANNQGLEPRTVGFDIPVPERLDAGIDVARIS